MSHYSFNSGDTDNNLLRKILSRLNDGISIVGSGDIPAGVPVVAVANFPLLQQIYGAVAVTNFPTFIDIGNFPAVQTVSVNNFPAVQPVSGSVSVTNEVLVMGTVDVGNEVGVQVNNFPATQPISAVSLPLPTGAATEATLVKQVPTPQFQANFYETINGKAARAWHIMGRRAGFNSTTALQDVAEFLTASDLLPEPTGAEDWEMVSSSPNDAFPAGTGTRTVYLTYLDSNLDIQTVGVDLNGVTPVPFSLSIKFVLFMEAFLGGNLETSAGNIDLRVAGTGVIHERISAGGNRSLTARWMVPRNYTGYIADWQSTAQGTNFTADVRLRAKKITSSRVIGNRYIFQDNCFVSGGNSVSASIPWLRFPAGCAIKPSAICSAAASTNRLDVDFSILLVHD